MSFKKTIDLYKYHPVTGEELEPKEEGLLVGKTSGLPFYLSRHLTAVVIIENDKGEILLVQRRVDPYKGTWDFPGGFVSLSDPNIESAATRELEEELGIVAKPEDLKYFGSIIDEYPHHGELEPIMTVVFKLSLSSETEITSKDDVSDTKWVKLDEVSNFQIGFASMQAVLNKYVSSTT